MPNESYFDNHEDYLEWFREYRKKNRKKLLEYKRKWIKNYRKLKGMKKDNARSKLKKAVDSGKLKRQPCVSCGDVNTHGHHENYSKPLDVIWLCRRHHDELHFNKRHDIHS